VRSSDTVARLGGDEFVVVVREVNDEGIQTIAEKVLATISEPVNVNGREFQLSASIGISVFPTHGATYDELLAAADRAMYQVKETGKKGIAFARGGYGSLTTT
jgi:diguanylate cyclase (GGDEF)-like protein